MKRLFFLFSWRAVVCAVADAQELTIQSIYAPAGLTGRAPDTVKWSPDGKKVSYFLHQEQGDKADLYYIDVATGKPAVLVAAEKIAAMKPPASASKDDREKDNRERYHVAGYHWAPDSEHILFDANGQLWYLHAGHRQVCGAERRGRVRQRSQVLSGRQAALLCPQAQSGGESILTAEWKKR